MTLKNRYHCQTENKLYQNSVNLVCLNNNAIHIFTHINTHIHTHTYWGFPGGSDGKESACNAGSLVQSLGWEDPMEKGLATHSSILAWSISWTEEAGVVQSMGSQRVRHDWATNTFTFLTHICIYKYTHTYTEREREKVKLLLLVTQLYSTFYNSMDYSTLVSSVRGISQARKLERVIISFSRES